MPWTALFFIAFALFIVFFIVQTRRAGPLQVDASAIANGQLLRDARRGDAGSPWGKLGNRTTANGLDLQFDHDDDPQAEATMYVNAAAADHQGSILGQPLTVRLSESFETHHVHTAGCVFQVTLRGAPSVVGRETRIQMLVDKDNQPLGGRIENDDDIAAAVGDWIEIERATIIQLRSETS